MRHFPLFYDLRGRKVLVVGGGAMAARKAAVLARAGARVHVVARDTGAPVRALIDDGRAVLTAGVFTPDLLEGMTLAVSASGDEETDRSVSAEAQARGIPVNVVDKPSLCSFYLPSIVDRSPLVVAISSGGAAPVLARGLRARIEAMLPAGLGALAAMAGRCRERVGAQLHEGRARLRFWNWVFRGPVAARALDGDIGGAEEDLIRALEDPAAPWRRDGGRLHMVVAPGGRSDHVTLAALQMMQEADIIFHDAGVARSLCDLARRDADLVAVSGKEPLSAVATALAGGRRVVRLLTSAPDDALLSAYAAAIGAGQAVVLPHPPSDVRVSAG